MKTMYFKEDRYLDNKPNIELMNEEIENVKVAVKFNEVEYQLREELPEGSKIIGYCELSKHKNKKISIKENKVNYTISDKVPVKIKKSLFEKIVGYVKVEDMDGYYVACTKKSYIILILLLLIMGLLCGFPVSLLSSGDRTVKEEMVPGTDEKGNGELGKEAPKFEQGPTFRMRLNCTPAIEDGKINIRIESPAEDNKGFAFITEVYLLAEMDSQGKIIENFAEPKLIYTSPLVYANENVEYGTLTEEVEVGSYIGRALYKIYDEEGNFLTQTACKLNVVSK